MSSEDPLFILYVSNFLFVYLRQVLIFNLYSDFRIYRKPKGVVHTTGGYLLCAALTVKYVFDVHPDNKFACMADIGWITGHTYIVYGPLTNGVSTTVFESTPVYPTPSRYWQTVQKHQLAQFYSASIAIRLLRRLGAQHIENHDLSSLRVLGSVGEPINPKAWNWYSEHVGKQQCAIVDTFWYVNSRSICDRTQYPLQGKLKLVQSLSPHSLVRSRLSLAPQLFPSSASSLLFWTLLAERYLNQCNLFNYDTDKVLQELEGNNVKGVLVIKQPWPSIARSVYNDHNRYLETYMKPYAGVFYTGDGAAHDEHGYIWIKGRIDGEDLLWKMSRL
jgi:acetyl-CoA synthetase